MVCEHLRQLENKLVASGMKETYRGQPWTKECREWVYFDCYLDNNAIRQRISFADCVKDHAHLGTHDGRESGFYCTQCHDGVMGLHESDKHNAKNVFVG